MATPYFTIAELRDLPQMADAVKYTDARINSTRDAVETLIEKKCGAAFVVRQAIETFSGDEANSGGLMIVLSEPYARAVTALTSNGVVFTAPQLAELSLRAGVLERRSGYGSLQFWDSGIRNLVVTYDHGYTDAPPPDLKEAAMVATRDRLMRKYNAGGVSDRATSLSTEMGTTTFLTANADRRPTGLPDVDAVIMSYADELDVFGFA